MIQKLDNNLKYWLAFVNAIAIQNLLFQVFLIQGLDAIHLLINLLLTLKFALIVGAISLIFSFIKSNSAKSFYLIYYLIILLICQLLLIYFQQTGIFLGADLFGYSLDDITHTIQASASFQITPWLILMASIFVFIFSLRKLMKVSDTWEPIIYVYILLSILAWFPLKTENWSASEASYFQIQNPSLHFFDKSLKLAFSHFGQERSDDFPLLHPTYTEADLSKFFNFTPNQLPNIVIITVEGLGTEFVGTDSKYGGAMPFLDSLTAAGLYWKNCLSNTGRTFGALPSITGSLPYGNSGFMALGAKMPAHYTLYNLLKPTHHTSYFYGGNANFDNQDIFLENQGIDFLMDESKFPADTKKMEANEEGFSWGFGDMELFNAGFDAYSTFPSQPKLAFFMTLTTHEPFKVPEPKYETIGATRMSNSDIYQDYPGIFHCLAYTDDAIRDFMIKCSKREDFHNTIFIFTGDHRLIPLPSAYRFDRFRVPLIIYSPLLNQPSTFDDFVVHSQITPTLLALLSSFQQISLPATNSFISDPIRIPNQVEIALMRNKNELQEYVSGNALYSNEKLYKISKDGGLSLLENDSLKSLLQQALSTFDAKSKSAIAKDQLVKDRSFLTSIKRFTLSKEESKFINNLDSIQRIPDSIYFEARQFAANKDYEKCRTLLKYGLNLSPNYHDMRLLMARSFAWQGQYDSALYYIDETYRRNDHFEDTYNAYSDLYFYQDGMSLSGEWALKGLELYPSSNALLTRKARYLFKMNQHEEARSILQEVLSREPDFDLALQIYQWLENEQ